MKKASPGREPNKPPTGTYSGRNTSTSPSNLASNKDGPVGRSASKSPIRKLPSSKSRTKTSKSMTNEFVLELLGTDSVSDINLASWKAITEQDIAVGISSSNTAQAKKPSKETERRSGVYQLGEDKEGRVEEPHVLKDEEGGRELGSNESSSMSMDGEGPAPASAPAAPLLHTQLDLDTIDNFRSFKEVDNELVKKIMKIDLNVAEIVNKKKNSFQAAPVAFTKKVEPSTSKKGLGTAGTGTKANTTKPAAGGSKKAEKVDPRPGRYRVIVNNEKRSRSPTAGPKSPYECDWIDLNGKRKASKEDGDEFAAYVTSGEYRLLKGFKPKDPKAPPAPVSYEDGYGAANYPGFSTKAPFPSKTAIAPSTSTKPGTNSISVQTDFLFGHSNRKRTTETQTQSRRVGFDLGSNTVQVYEVDHDQLTSSTVLSSKNENESKCRAIGVKMVPIDEADDSLENKPAHLVLKLDELRQLDLSREEDLKTFKAIHRHSVEELQVGILSVAEMSEIVLHTLFKNPFSSQELKQEALEGDEYFQEFMSARTDREALEKMIKVFASTCNRIMNHLDLADAFEVVLKKRGNFISGVGLNQLSIMDALGHSYELGNDDQQNHLELCLTNTVHGHKEFASVQSGSEPTRNEYAMTLLVGKTGQLVQHIYYKNMQFSLVYSGNDTVVSSLVTANRESFQNTPLKLGKLQAIVSRNASYVSGRLTSSKFFMSRVIEELGVVVQSFLVGKYLKPLLPYTRTSSKTKVKLQSLNVYAGLIYQLSTGLSIACKKLQSCLSKAMKLDLPAGSYEDSFVGPRNRTNYTEDLHFDTKIPVKEAMEDFAQVIQEIDSILLTGKLSLASLSRGVKVKSKHVKVIELMLDAVQQLQVGHGIDFGTVMIGLLCSTEIGAAEQVTGNVVVTLQKLHASATELVKYTKKIGLLSSFVASKTLYKIRSLQKEEQRGEVNGGSGLVPFLNRLLRTVGFQWLKKKRTPCPNKAGAVKAEVKAEADLPLVHPPLLATEPLEPTSTSDLPTQTEASVPIPN